jgi:hypothetical protein
MKNILLAFTLLVMFGCEPNEEQVNIEYQKLVRAKENAKRQKDSTETANLISGWGVNYKERIDSANKVAEKEQKRKQKGVEAALKKKYGMKFWKIHVKHPEWSLDLCKDLSDHKSWIGMTYEMLICSRGKPNTINTSNYGSGNNYQCCWDDWNPSCFYMGSDDIITSYN